MKKAIFVVIAFLLVAAAMIPAFADVYDRAWLGTTFTGVDTYYDQSMTIYAYKEGATAVVAVTVRNTNGTSRFNVTSVYAKFDWGNTYTSSQVSTTNQAPLQSGAMQVFFINFAVPNVTQASNLYRHSYTIYAGYTVKNATGTNWLTGTYQTSYNDFIVYSTDQAGAMDLARIIDNSSPPSGGWTSAKAKILWNEAENETGSGQAYYAEGDFTRAQQRFSAALSDINSAWSAEQDYTTALEDLQIGQIQAEINGMNAWASFLNGFSTLWVLIGIGWVLLGIGYIIKWLRTKRPEYVYPAPAPAAQA
jgi:hypothetical protein